MDHLWSPWRYSYITGAEKQARPGVPTELAEWQGDSGCVFCNMISAVDDAVAHGMPTEKAERAAGIVLRREHVYICLNRYPYSSGHVMIVPYEHQASLAALPVETAREMIEAAQQIERALAEVYHPDGFNMGLNLGKAAGAGVAGHLHLHALPRWAGDTNFMAVIGETRVLPEDLTVTWQRLRAAFVREHSAESLDARGAS